MKVFKFGYTDSALVLLGHGRKMSLTSGAHLAATSGGTPGWARRGMGRLAGLRERKEKKWEREFGPKRERKGERKEIFGSKRKTNKFT